MTRATGGTAGTHRWRGPGRAWAAGRLLPARGAAAVAAAAVLAASGLAACGSSGGSAHGLSGQSLTVLTAAPTGAGAAEYRQYYAYIASLFRKQTGSVVKWQYFTSGTQLAQTMESAAATHSGPGVFSIGSSFDGSAYATHAFHVLTAQDWAQLGGRAGFVPKMLTMSGPSASQDIGVPFESIPFVMAYNKGLLARAGIKAPPGTWTQWVRDAQAVQRAEPGVNGTTFSPQDPYGPWKPVWSYAHQLGGGFTNAPHTKATFTSAAMQAAIRFYFAQLFQYHIVSPAELTWQAAQEEAAFAAGKTAMLAEASYNLVPELKGTPAASQVAFAPMPSVPYGMSTRPAGGEPAETIVSGNYYAIASYAPNTRLALAFIKASTSLQAQVQQFRIFGWMPVTLAGVRAVEKAYPASVPFIQAEENATPTAFTPAWSYIETGILAVISHVAQQLATSHRYDPGYVLSQLRAQNAVVQPHLSGS